MSELVVRVGGERRSVALELVREVLPLANLTPVPTAPAAVAGVTQVRGQVLAVLDVACLAVAEAAPATGTARTPHLGDPVVVVEHEGARAALWVDAVEAVGGDAPPLDVAALLARLVAQS